MSLFDIIFNLSFLFFVFFMVELPLPIVEKSLLLLVRCLWLKPYEMVWFPLGCCTNCGGYCGAAKGMLREKWGGLGLKWWFLGVFCCGGVGWKIFRFLVIF